MAVASPTYEWQELSSRFYHRRELYELSWDVDLEKHLVAAAGQGGPIAVTRDDRKIVLLGKSSTRPVISIYNAAGRKLAHVPWTKGRIVSFDWVNGGATAGGEQLLAVLVDDGEVYLYNVQGEQLPLQFSMGEECAHEGVLASCFWTSGLAIITKITRTLIVTTSLSLPNPVRMEHAAATLQQLLPLPDNLHSGLEDDGKVDGEKLVGMVAYFQENNFAVDEFDGRTWAVAVAVEDSLIVVDELHCDVHDLNLDSFISRIAVLPNSSRMAVVSKRGTLYFRMAEEPMRDLFLPFPLGEGEESPSPDQLLWCADDAVLLRWGTTVVMVAADESHEVLDFTEEDNEAVVLVQEPDSVRFISNLKHELLHPVDDSTARVFGVGSTSPGALLYDALEDFEDRNVRSETHLRSIGSQMQEAISDCIGAALNDLEIRRQQRLLRAASYGHAFLADASVQSFRDAALTLRVLGAVRRYDVAIPITYAQYRTLTPNGLLERLAYLHHHLLALRIATSLGLPSEHVLQHWARAKVTRSQGLPAETIRSQLVERLQHCPGLSYADIAEDAYHHGQQELAVLLLENEVRAAKQIPLLLTMGQDAEALDRAVESGDTDLVHVVLLHVKDQGNQQRLFELVERHFMALQLFVQYCRAAEPDLLKAFYDATQQTEAPALLHLEEAFVAPPRPDITVGGITKHHGSRAHLLKLSAMRWSQNKDNIFQAKACEEAVALTNRLLELEEKTGQPIFADSSLADAIRTCIVTGNHKQAQKLRSDFKMADKQFYWLKIRSLASTGDWSAVEAFAKVDCFESWLCLCLH